MMTNEKYDIISNCTSICTGAFGIANIQEILGVIVLILSILNILITTGFKAYNHIKEKKYVKIKDDIEDAKRELEELNKNIQSKN